MACDIRNGDESNPFTKDKTESRERQKAMTKKDMLETMYEEYKFHKDLYKIYKERAREETDETARQKYKRDASLEWYAAFSIECLADKMFGNARLFDRWIEEL